MNFKPKVLVVGASTGGPSSLEKVFSELTGPYQIPVIVVQHMPPVFTEAFASRLGKIVGVPAAEAKHDELLVPNRIYVAPGDYHLTLEMSDRGVKLCLDQGPHRNSVRPAVDPLFESAARIFGKDCLGLVMTGMGYDGKVGAEAIKTEGGAVMIQSPESCIVYGMPAAVKESGAFDRCLDLEDIAANLCRHLCSPASGQGSPASGQGSPSSSQEVRTA